MIVDSEDIRTQVTPLFVRDAGARGYTGGNKSFSYWNPYYDDPVFKEKWTNFVCAMAAQYDDPAIVDWVELGLGKWGEMHTLWPARGHATTDRYHGNDIDVVRWDVDLFARSFKKVLVAAQFGMHDDATMDHALKAGTLDIMSPRLVCQPHVAPGKTEAVLRQHLGPGHRDDGGKLLFQYCEMAGAWSPFYPNLNALIKGYRRDAEECHANTLSINTHADADTYFQNYKDSLLIPWSRECGYQLYPVSIVLPEHPVPGSKIDVTQSWCNAGIGRMPNASPRWHYKYRVAFAWIDDRDAVVASTTTSTEPSSWLAGRTFITTEPVTVPDCGKEFALGRRDRGHRREGSAVDSARDGGTTHLWHLV